MNKKILTLAILAITASHPLMAKQINKATNAGVYGAILGANDDSEDFYMDHSHLNGYLDYKLNHTNSIKLNVGIRSEKDGSDYDYSFNVDEAYYRMDLSDYSNVKIGRLYTPIGIYSDSVYDYGKHPFTVMPNPIDNIEGVSYTYGDYIGTAKRHSNFELTTFAGTNLEDVNLGGVGVDLDTLVNFGVNTKIKTYGGDFNAGVYVSLNGDNIKAGDKVISDDDGTIIQTNLGYEYNDKLYILAEYNRYSYEADKVDGTLDTLDFMFGYDFDIGYGDLMPMIGFESYSNDGFLISQSSKVETETLKAGLRYSMTKYTNLLLEYDNITGDYEDSLIKAGVTFSY